MLVRPVIRALVRPPARGATVRGRGGIDLRALLWPTGTEAGMWLDPSDTSTVFQDSTGTTPGAIESPVGLQLDKRFGLALGSELITNGDGSTTTGWTVGTNTTISTSGGYIKGLATANGGCWFGQNIGAVSVGQRIKITFDAGNDGTSLAPFVRVGTVNGTGDINATDTAAFGSHSVTFNVTSASASCWVWFFATSPLSGQYILIRNISTKVVQGNHVLQATATARPTWKLASGIYSDLFDGTDDGYATGAFVAGTLTANMDCFAAIRRTVDVQGAPFRNESGGSHFGTWGATATANSAFNAVGTPTLYVNGTQIASSSQSDLKAAMPVGSWVVQELRGLDLSAWAQFMVGLYPSFMIAADIGGVILCPAQSDATRAIVRRELGRKVGLSL